MYKQCLNSLRLVSDEAETKFIIDQKRTCYRNHFIEFSAHPELIEIKGDTFTDRLRYIASFNQVANTNLEAVFQLILDAAVKNSGPQPDLPEKLYIISDMEIRPLRFRFVSHEL